MLNINIIPKIKFLIGRFRLLFIAVLLLMTISVFFEMIGLSLIYPLISYILGDFDNSYLKLIQGIINNSSYFDINFKNNEVNNLLILIILIFIIYTFKAIFSLILILASSTLTFKLQADISNKLFTKYLYQEYSMNIESNSSSKIRNIITETQVFSIEFIIPLLLSLTDLMTVLGIGFILFVFLPELSMISLALIIFLCLIYLFITKKTIKKLGHQRQDFEDMRLKFFNEGMSSLKELKISQKEKMFFNNFSKFNIQLSNVATKQSFLTSAPQALLEYMAICFLIILIFYLNLNSTENFKLISSLGLFTAAFFKLIPCLYRLVSCFNRIRYSTPVVNLLYSELEKFIEPKIVKSKIFNFGNKKDSISLKKVNFKFSEENEFIFKNLNISFKLGNFIGIKGKSGSGKSTLIDLILGLNKPQDGKILFNDKQIKKNISKYYGSFYYLPQSIYLVEDSIMKNILFSEENEYDEDLLNKAIEIADLKNFIKSLDKGIFSRIGENGSKISGGQKQRIGIARAIYNKANILVMDESTNALDFDTEKKIIQSLKKSNLIQSIFFITHREKMLEYCDLAFEVKNKTVSKINLKI